MSIINTRQPFGPKASIGLYMWKRPVVASFNSLAPGKVERNFRYVIFKRILVIDGWGISCEIVLIWMTLDFTDDKSRLVQVMDWCRQTTSHYLIQCWPRSVSLYGVTRPQWVNSLVLEKMIICVTCGLNLSCETARMWLSLNLSDDKSTLVQVMAWCHQATSHYLSHCWPRSMSKYGISRPQWVHTSCCLRGNRSAFLLLQRSYRWRTIITCFVPCMIKSWL